MVTNSAHGFLEEASEAMKARASLRDAQGGERSMAKTVAIFNAWTGSNMSEDDGWRFMIALKQAREIQGKYNRDDYVDLAAYCGLLGEFESGSRPHPLKATLPKIDLSMVGPTKVFGKINASDLGMNYATNGNKEAKAPWNSVMDYALQTSAYSQVDTYRKEDGPVGVPFGAISLGSCLDEE